MPETAPPTILVCQPLLFQKPGDYSRILEQGGFQIRYPRVGGKVLTEAQLADELKGVQGTIASTEPYTPAILERATSLRIVSRTGVGYDSVHVAAATERGILVACTPGTNHHAVAEQVFALLLAAAKRVVVNHAEVAQGGFRRQTSLALRGKLLGVVGLGRIGRAVARLAEAFQMPVIAHDPFLSSPPDDTPGVRIVSLDELFATCDVISLHAAATDATRRLINRESLQQMKPGVILINTARGTLVDEPALCEALQSGHVGGAGLDVFEREPPSDSPLLAAPNVVLSPHVAGVDQQAIEDMATMAAQTIVELSQGGWPEERLVNGGDVTRPWSWTRG
ncbi:MAG: phosphoglycerate dehydrogenase [Planctomycetales bacterium]